LPCIQNLNASTHPTGRITHYKRRDAADTAEVVLRSMKAVRFVVLLVSCGFLTLTAAASDAQVRPDNRTIVRDLTNERGFTLDMFDSNFWQLARHPSPASIDQFGELVHRPPTRGIQFELLTPGDFGATIHLYW